MSLPTLNYYEAQLAIYLDRGIEMFWRINHAGQGCFNEAFCGEGDLERTQRLIYLAKKLFPVIAQGCDLPWSQICYQLVEHNLCFHICQNAQSMTDEEIVQKFSDLLAEQIKRENADD